MEDSKLLSKADTSADVPSTESAERCLIDSVLAGDLDRYSELVTKHKTAVYSLILRMVGDVAVSDELSHEVFVKAYVALKTFRGEASLRTWLLRIATNHVNSYFVSKTFRQRRKTQSFELKKHDVPAAVESTEKDLLAKFYEVLPSVHPTFREVLVLCGVEERPYEEVAQLLGVPIGTIRSRLNRGRKQLKELLGTMEVE